MSDDTTLYLSITRGHEPKPILATSDPGVLRAVARALFETLTGEERVPALRLARELDADPGTREGP